MLPLWQEVRRDRAFYWVIAAYGLAVALIAFAVGQTDKLAPLAYIYSWLVWVTIACLAIVATIGVASLRAEKPIAAMTSALQHVGTTQRAAGAILFLALAVFHGLFTSMKTMLTDLIPFMYDVQLADLDAALHGGDPWRLIPLIPALTRTLQWLYLPAWFLLIGTVSAYATMFAPRELRDRYIWSFIICWIVLGNLIAGVVMSAGPCFYEQVTGSDRFAPLMDYLSFSETSRMSSFGVQKIIWEQHVAGTTDFGAGISAFPSMHLAIPTLWTLLAWQARPWLGGLLALFTALILIGSVHLGWHYAIDSYFSILFALAAWKLVALAQAWPARRRLEVVV